MSRGPTARRTLDFSTKEPPLPPIADPAGHAQRRIKRESIVMSALREDDAFDGVSVHIHISRHFTFWGALRGILLLSAIGGLVLLGLKVDIAAMVPHLINAQH